VFAQPPKPRIIGPTIVQTPKTLNFEVIHAERFGIRWRVNKSPNVSINGETNRQQVNVGFIGKGVDTLVVELTAFQSPFNKIFDTLIIRKNSCPAIAGSWVNKFPRTCSGQVIHLALDTLKADSILWQYSENPRFFWVNDRLDRFPQQPTYSSPLLAASRFYRAVAMSGSCRDTTVNVFVRVDLSPSGSFRITFNRSICAGEVTPNLSARTQLGIGRWTTNGKGTFSSVANPNAVYRSSPFDTGKVWLAWMVGNFGCDSARYVDTLNVRRPPLGGINTNRINACPTISTEPLSAFVSRGVGKWLPVEGSTGKFLDDKLPNTTFTPSLSDRNKELTLRWRISNENCDSIYSIKMKVADAEVAEIIFPKRRDKLIVCPDIGIRLQADTVGRTGTYQWISTQPILEGRFSPTPLVQIVSDSGVFYLAFEDFKTGCRSVDTTILFLQKEKPIFYVQSDTICFNDRKILQLIGADTLQAVSWSPTTGLDHPNSFQPVFTPTRADTVYTFTVKGVAKNINCPTQTEVKIYVKPNLRSIVTDPNNRTPNKFCTNYPNFVKITNRNSCRQWAWFNEKASSVLEKGSPDTEHPNFISRDSILNIQGLPPREYNYCVACLDAQTGCTSLTDFSFEVVPVPIPAFSVSEKVVPYVNRLVQFQNRSIGGINYSWDFGDYQSGTNNNSQLDNPSHFFSTAGKYLITLVADNNACSKSFSDTIRVLEEEYYFPNSFTPNGDGINDVFRPLPAYWDGSDSSISSAKVLSFEIYAPNGGKIYELKSDMEWADHPGWKGTNQNNTPAEAGTYLYKVTILQEPRGKVTHTGFINLIR
jgi:PKD repeat protein